MPHDLFISYAHQGGCWLLRCEGRDRLLPVFRTLVNDLAIELTDEEKLDDTIALIESYPLPEWIAEIPVFVKN
jgi:hypothetical protein